jgi:predicted Zn-dependent protease
MGFAELQAGRYAAAEQRLRDSVTGNPRTPFYAVALAAAIAEQGRREEARQVIAEVAQRHPSFGTGSIASFWVAVDPRFTAGRDRIIARATELGLPP